jgi:hypothetical protein
MYERRYCKKIKNWNEKIKKVQERKRIRKGKLRYEIGKVRRREGGGDGGGQLQL